VEKVMVRIYLTLCVLVALHCSPTALAQEAGELTPTTADTQQVEASSTTKPVAERTRTAPKGFKTPITTQSTPKVGSGAFFAQVMIGLLFVLACIYALAWIVKRMGQGGFLANNQMKIVSTLAVGTRERVVVLDVGGQQIMLGITPQNINKLHVFEHPVIHSDPGSVSDTAVGDFSDKIKFFMQKGSK